MRDGDQHQLIIFRAGPEEFVLDIRAMVQIIAHRHPTPVPRAAAFIEGIIVLRDQVVPILDLRSRLFPGLTDEPHRPKILVLTVLGHVVGMKVDSVHRIITVGPEDILPPPSDMEGVDSSFLKGVVRWGDGIYLYLDTDALLTEKEMSMIEKSRTMARKRYASTK